MSSYNPFSLEGKTILVTGASSGIGKATAIECSKLGAKLVVTGRNVERLNETYIALDGEGHVQINADLATIEGIDSLISKLPLLNGCVLNAGISKLALTQFIKEDDLKNILQVNTISPIMLTQRLVKRKKVIKGSSIVFSSSIAGNFTVSFGHAMYAISKGGISSFMKSAALDLAPKGIRCNSVNPGMVQTKLIQSGTLTDDQLQADMNNYPLKRYGRPEEIAYAIIYLLSDASSWVTGHSLVIDGGITLK